MNFRTTQDFRAAISMTTLAAGSAITGKLSKAMACVMVSPNISSALR